MKKDKDKKLTVQFYANTKLKSKSREWNGNEIQMYPLYVRVIYDAANTRFKADFRDENIYVDEELKRLDAGDMKADCLRYKNEIENIVKKEVMAFQDRFTLAGIGYRLNVYKLKLGDIFRLMVVAELQDLLEKFDLQLKPNLFGRDTFALMSFLLRSEISLYDWLLGSGKQVFKEKMEAAGASEKEILLGVNLVDESLKIKME